MTAIRDHRDLWGGDTVWRQVLGFTADGSVNDRTERSDAAESGVILADATGRVTLQRITDGSPAWSLHPGEPTGRFTGILQAPRGGLYGTHILESRVTWSVMTVEGQREARATTIGTFDQTDPKGHIPRIPAYDAVIRVGGRDGRSVSGGGSAVQPRNPQRGTQRGPSVAPPARHPTSRAV